MRFRQVSRFNQKLVKPSILSGRACFKIYSSEQKQALIRLFNIFDDDIILAIPALLPVQLRFIEATSCLPSTSIDYATSYCDTCSFSPDIFRRASTSPKSWRAIIHPNHRQWIKHRLFSSFTSFTPSAKRARRICCQK